MRGTTDHYQKFESQTVDAKRDRRNRVASTQKGDVGHTIKYATHGTQTTASMAALGYISTPIGFISKRSIHPSIDQELEEYLRGHDDLKASVSSSIERIQTLFKEAEIRAFLERDPADQRTARPVIGIKIPFDSIEEYRSIKSRVREEVRKSETEGTIIYTRINRA